MDMRAADGRTGVLVALTCMVALGAPPANAWAQDPDPPAVAARVHQEGGYPSDITVLDEETRGEGYGGGGIDDGAGDGPHGSVNPNGIATGATPRTTSISRVPRSFGIS